MGSLTWPRAHLASAVSSSNGKRIMDGLDEEELKYGFHTMVKCRPCLILSLGTYYLPIEVLEILMRF